MTIQNFEFLKTCMRCNVVDAAGLLKCLQADFLTYSTHLIKRKTLYKTMVIQGGTNKL